MLERWLQTTKSPIRQPATEIINASKKDLLRDLQRALSLSVVMITHDIDDLAALAEQVVVIDHGRVVREIDLSDGATRLPALRALQPESLAPHQLARRGVLSKAFAQPWNEGMPS